MEFYATVLVLSGRRRVAGDRLLVPHPDRLEPFRGHAALHQDLFHAIGPLLRHLHIFLVGSDAVRVPLDPDRQLRFLVQLLGKLLQDSDRVCRRILAVGVKADLAGRDPLVLHIDLDGRDGVAPPSRLRAHRLPFILLGAAGGRRRFFLFRRRSGGDLFSAILRIGRDRRPDLLVVLVFGRSDERTRRREENQREQQEKAEREASRHDDGIFQENGGQVKLSI
jgi:hypothetical protein